MNSINSRLITCHRASSPEVTSSCYSRGTGIGLQCGAANLVSGERREHFGNCRVSLKGIAKGEGERRAGADKRRNMATGSGENGKNVQEKKERTNEERKEEVERFAETSWERFRRDLRSSWGPIAK